MACNPKMHIIFTYNLDNPDGKHLFPDTVSAPRDGHAKTRHSLCEKHYRIDENIRQRAARGFPAMLVDYMRASSETDRQTTDLQRDALLAAGIDPRQLFTDQASGARDDRPGLQQALASVQPGDCLIVWKLDRLGRSLPHLLQIVLILQAQGVALRSLTEQMETTTLHGAFLFSLFGGSRTCGLRTIMVNPSRSV